MFSSWEKNCLVAETTYSKIELPGNKGPADNDLLVACRNCAGGKQWLSPKLGKSADPRVS